VEVSGYDCGGGGWAAASELSRQISSRKMDGHSLQIHSVSGCPSTFTNDSGVIADGQMTDEGIHHTFQ
jgi:cytochrome c-type biogenesis protein CcmE